MTALETVPILSVRKDLVSHVTQSYWPECLTEFSSLFAILACSVYSVAVEVHAQRIFLWSERTKLGLRIHLWLSFLWRRRFGCYISIKVLLWRVKNIMFLFISWLVWNIVFFYLILNKYIFLRNEYIIIRNECILLNFHFRNYCWVFMIVIAIIWLMDFVVKIFLNFRKPWRLLFFNNLLLFFNNLILFFSKLRIYLTLPLVTNFPLQLMNLIHQLILFIEFLSYLNLFL